MITFLECKVTNDNGYHHNHVLRPCNKMTLCHRTTCCEGLMSQKPCLTKWSQTFFSSENL